ncbi:alpha/beta fold hydrolase [uncultured Jatrophihabitans sp.]|uniref:alpha/beta fold hydrolase n=1 Tax=uncultured Jatrophihabitans sp. TaxID=1610747 RepID=UPI0035CCA9A8
MPKPPSRTAPEAKYSDAELAPLEDSHIWPGEDVTVNGIRLNVRTTPTDAPDAEPALFVHGLGGSAHNWTDFAAVLRHRLAVEAIDLPGHGRSGPAKDYRPAAHARIVIAYLEQSGRGPVHLVGNSMGGAISLLVAARRPDLVRTLTLVSPAVPDNRLRIYPLKNDPRVALMVLPVLGELVLKQFTKKYAVEARVAGTIRLCFADRKRYPKARMEEAFEEARARMDMPWADTAMLRSMRGLVRSQFLRGRSGWTTMRKITAPTLVVWGDADKLVAPDLAAYVAAAIPDSRLAVLEDIGHTAMMEDPVATARMMLALVDEASSTG